MAHKLTTIGFDADDTLWHHERYFRLTETHFINLLADHAEPDALATRLHDAERRNIAHYGFGVKGFTLSMIETAVEITEGRVPGKVIAEIIAAGREMLTHPIEHLPHAAETLEKLTMSHRLVLITKGDLFDQERKLAQSGLGDYFAAIEIVSEKTEPVYRRIFARHGEGADQAMMVGNSIRSDVLPAIAAGAWGIHVPHNLIFAFEHAEPPLEASRFRQITHLGELEHLVSALDANPDSSPKR